MSLRFPFHYYPQTGKIVRVRIGWPVRRELSSTIIRFPEEPHSVMCSAEGASSGVRSKIFPSANGTGSPRSSNTHYLKLISLCCVRKVLEMIWWHEPWGDVLGHSYNAEAFDRVSLEATHERHSEEKLNGGCSVHIILLIRWRWVF